MAQIRESGSRCANRSELRVYPRLGYAIAVIANETSFPTGDFTRLVVR